MQASTPTLLMPTTGFSAAEATFASQAAQPTAGERTTSAAASLLGSPAGELVLRIGGGEHAGRVLRIQSAKCLIGSAAGCTLRLRTKHIRPVHVLILRGPHGAVVRAWSRDVLLNDRACEEGPIQAGDVLQIGPLKVYIDQVNEPVAKVRPEADDFSRTPSTRQHNPRLARRRKQLIGILRKEREQQSSLQHTIAEQRTQLVALQDQLAKLPAAGEPVANDALTSQLRHTIEQLQQELAAAAKRRATEQQSAARQRQLFDEQMQQRLQSELDRQREQLTTCHQRQLDQARTELSRRIEQAKAAERLTFTAELESLQAEVATAREEKQTLDREIDSLKLALQTKSSGEELARLSAATQIEQLSRAFELVREERDELFQRLQDEQQLFDQQVSRWQAQIDDARASALNQLNQGEEAAQKQLGIVRAELATRDAQLFELQQQSREREAQIQDEYRRQIAELRVQLTAKAEAEESRRVADAAKITQLTATIDSLRQEVEADANARQQQQDGFTQVRKRLEAEISALNARLEQSDNALHEVRVNSGLVHVEVLAEAERARAERDAVREQMLRQQEEWTDFRSRLEHAATEERELAGARYQQLQEELTGRITECEQFASQLLAAEHRLREVQAKFEATSSELSERTLELELQASDLGHVEQRRRELQLQLETALDDLTQQSLECEQFKTDLSNAERRQRELQTQLDSVVSEREGLTSENGSLRQAVSEQQVQLEQLRTEFRQLKGDLEATIAAQATFEQAAQGQERELTSEIARLQDDVASRDLDCELLRQRLRDAEVTIMQLQSEVNVAAEARVVVEREAAGRLQQMTISMDQLQQEQSCGEALLDEERAEWTRQRESLDHCIAELQREVSTLKESLASAQEQTRLSTAESLDRAQLAEQQLQAAQAQVAEWQSIAEQARQQATELSQSIERLRQQEQLWQSEREQLDFSQQSSNERLQQLESSITELQQQLALAQSSVASPSTSPSQTMALDRASDAGAQFGGDQIGSDQFGADQFGGTINIEDQELAALQEQLANPIPSLFAPRGSNSDFNSEVLKIRTTELDERAEQLAAQQAQLEEDQALVARQRIELEQFQASLAELERSLIQRQEQLAQGTPVQTSQEDAPAELVDESHSYASHEVERESNPLSESEAFAAMADQVAALYRTPPPAKHKSESEVASAPGKAESSSQESATGESDLSGSPVEDLPESLVISSPAEPATREVPEPNGILAPVVEEEFENTLDARVARVMGRESNPWHKADTENPAEDVSMSQSDAVNNVLDRLREAGLWKGEGTAKVDQLPSSDPPVDGGATVLYRPVEEREPITASDPAPQALLKPEPVPVVEEPAVEVPVVEEPVIQGPVEPAHEENVAPPPRPQGSPSLLQTPTIEETEADDSIENYMSRLMQRLRSTNEADSPSDSLRKSSSRVTSVPSRAIAPAATPEPVAPPKPVEVTPLTSLSDLAPRSQAPEANANLAAMRELANSAARGAIEQHQQKSGQQRINARTVNTALAVVVAAGLFYCWYQTGAALALGGAALALLWGLSSSLLAGLQTATLRRTSAPEDEPKTP